MVNNVLFQPLLHY